ncbi:MAG: gliding motility-associated C-terminal domain-containing protein [Cyclobacteriaceae bacterium]
MSITSKSGLFSFCEGTSLTLQASGSGFDSNSYLWNTSATTDSIQVTTDGSYSVSAKATASGCLITAQQTVTKLPVPVITVSAVPTTVDEGKPTQLTASGLDSYAWHPGKTLSDSTVANPVATPFITTYYKVTGVGANGCSAIDSILVNVKGESIVNKLKPKNLISPGNGDLINEKWEIDNIQNYPQCGVTIYDDKGIKVYESKPYNNDCGRHI